MHTAFKCWTCSMNVTCMGRGCVGVIIDSVDILSISLFMACDSASFSKIFPTLEGPSGKNYE